MKNELEHIYDVKIDVLELDRDEHLKPSSYQVIINRVAEEHIKTLGLDIEATMVFGLSWVLVSMTVDIKKQIKGCQVLKARTWHSQRKGPFFRREMEVVDKDGEVVFYAATYSVLLDLEKRSIYRKKELPFELGEETKVLLVDCSYSFKEKHEYEDIAKRKVERSFIDCLGHVNNCRYGEFAYDALSDEEANLSNLSRIDIYFISELRPQDNFTVQKAICDNRVIIRGYNELKEDISFNVVLGYKKMLD